MNIQSTLIPQEEDTEYDVIERDITSCKKCTLYKTRTNAVIGGGNNKADILFIGEAPGKNEDEQGIPFVGRAGKVLDSLLETISLKREDIYIANILKCRPPNNRNPSAEEITACTPHLDRQIRYIHPKVICTLGTFSTNYILEHYGLRPGRISKLHGITQTTPNGMKIIPLYHPAASIYNQELRPQLEEDMKHVKNEIK